MKLQDQVTEFHRRFGLEVQGEPCWPQHPHTAALRVKLIEEELDELRESVEHGDLYGVADALADLAYVVVGAAVSFGIDLEPVLDEVHRSNMTKIWPDGKVHKNPDGKVIKPETYSPADIASALGLK